jgi:hypothetical protein
MIFKEEVLKRLKLIQDTQDERNEKFYSWLKNLITISIALFGLIISLKSGETKTQFESIFFICSIFSLALGILFALTTLFGEVNVLNRVKDDYYKQTLEYIDNNGKDIEFKQINPSLFYKISSYLYVFFYLTSLVSLVLYSTIEQFFSIICN